MDNFRFDDNRLSFLQMTSPPTSALPSPAPDSDFHGTRPRPLVFSSPASMLKHVTRHWQADFVTVDLRTRGQLEPFTTRPFVLVVSIDAPLLIRFRRYVIRSARSDSPNWCMTKRASQMRRFRHIVGRIHSRTRLSLLWYERR